MNLRSRLVFPMGLLGLLCFVLPTITNATTYTADHNIGDFTSLVSSYATFSNFAAGDVLSPFTPTSAELANNGFRVYNGNFTATGLSANNWILASFSSPTSSILVFPNIDHFGAAFDGYQYQIEGSNDLSSWTPLFDAISVNGVAEPFILGSFTGTAPSTVNNVLTPGAGPVGYEAMFNFGTAYQYYAFGASTEAINAGNTDQELSAVGAPVPEPASIGLFVIGFLFLLVLLKRKGLAQGHQQAT